MQVFPPNTICHLHTHLLPTAAKLSSYFRFDISYYLLQPNRATQPYMAGFGREWINLIFHCRSHGTPERDLGIQPTSTPPPPPPRSNPDTDASSEQTKTSTALGIHHKIYSSATSASKTAPVKTPSATTILESIGPNLTAYIMRICPRLSGVACHSRKRGQRCDAQTRNRHLSPCPRFDDCRSLL